MTNAEWCDTFENRVAKNIRKKREEENMTISRLSTRTGISWKTLENWETGKCAPSLSKFFLLCRRAGWNPGELIGGNRNGDQHGKR